MPNTGKPSQDCHLCRSRRVKCDLARPQCRRCIKYGATCPGYRDQQDLVFRHHSSSSSNTKKPPRKPTAKAQATAARNKPSSSSTAPAPVSPLSVWSSSSSSSPSSDEDDASWTAASPATGAMDDMASPTVRMQMDFLQLNRPVYEHWTAHSVPILLDVYSAFSFVGKLYTSSVDDGPLVWAAHLFSRTYTINVGHPTAIAGHSLPEARAELSGYMGRTLRAVGQALAEPDGAFRDDVLATVWILANYEILVGSLGHANVVSPWHLHARGLYSILKARGPRNRETPMGRTAFWSAFNIVQIDAIISTTECPPESADWLSAARKSCNMDLEWLPIVTNTYVMRVASIAAHMLGVMVLRDPPALAARYPGLVRELAAAERDLRADLALRPGSDRNGSAGSSSNPGGLGAGTTANYMDAFWISVYQACMVKANHMAHLMANYLTHFPGAAAAAEAVIVGMPEGDTLAAQRTTFLEKVHTGSDSIVDVSAAKLEPIRRQSSATPRSPGTLLEALRFVWPLSAVYTIPSTRRDHKDVCWDLLQFIGRELGVRQALMVAPGGFSGMVPSEANAPLAIEGAGA